MRSPQIIPSGAACGAEVQGVDIAAPGAIMAEALQRAVTTHLAVVVRGSALSAAQLLALGRVFGTPEAQGVSVLAGPSAPAAQQVVSSLAPPQRPTGSLGGGTAIWQSDLSYRVRPCSLAILHARALPAGGGSVCFANQYLAYDTLPDDLRARVAGRMLLHDESLDNEGRLREGCDPVTDPRQAGGAQHRMVRTHPQTGRKALYLGRRRNAYVIGLALEDSETLLDRLWAHATQPALLWRHDWRAGDTLIWDNRCVVYCHDVPDAVVNRDLLRVQIRGEMPR